METTLTPLPVALGPDAVIHLGANLEIDAIAVTPDFFAHTAADNPQLSQGGILSVFDYSATWPYWERHPTGEELVYLLAGDVELELDNGELQHAVRLRAGEAVIVPTGAWHRAAVHAPSRMLFVTPTPTRTEQRPAR